MVITETNQRRGLATGAMIYGMVSGMWVVIAVTAGNVGNWLLIGGCITLIVGLIFAAVRQLGQSTAIDNEEASQYGKALGIIFAVQGIAIGVGSGLLAGANLANWIVPWVAMVVGIHFFPVGRLFNLWLDHLLTIAIALLVTTTVISQPQGLWAAIISIGMALFLWLAGLGRLIQSG